MSPSLPRLGLGTWKNTDPEQCKASVKTAIEAGYRHIDTAQMYENEEAVGTGIASASVDRDDVFVATKVHPGKLAYDDVIESAKASLDRLGLDRVDLLYIHWPIDTYDAEPTLSAFNDLQDEGRIDAIGLSNFEPDLLDEAKAVLERPILAHQVELHPLNPQETLREYAQEDGHWIVGYCPLGRGELLSHPTIESVAEGSGCTPAQVLLAWALSKDNVAVIPKATGQTHIEENLAAQACEISSESIARIDAISERKRFVDPERAPWNR